MSFLSELQIFSFGPCKQGCQPPSIINNFMIIIKNHTLILFSTNTILNTMNKIDCFDTEQGIAFNSPRFHQNKILARFSPAFTRNLQAQFITEQVLVTLSDPNCFIGQNYHSQHWMQIFTFIDESHCRRFFLMQTGVPTIVQQISKIRFSHLKQMDLSNNKITNIENISFLKIPHIKSLVLKNNLILNINALRRGKWKNLEVLDIERNLVIEWKRIAEIHINKDQIDCFNIQFTNSPNLSEVQDIAKFYAKVACNSKAQKIENALDMFGLKNNKSQQTINSNIIQLRTKRYDALKRKFEGQR